MDLKEILSISGKPGLFKSVAQTKTGVIVESLIDNKRFQVFSSDKISSLGEISIYTSGEDMALRRVFKLMQEKETGAPVPAVTANDKELVEYFEASVPEYDKNRFYLSHMRKVIGWYHLLIEKGYNDFTEPEENQENELEVTPEAGTPAEKPE